MSSNTRGSFNVPGLRIFHSTRSHRGLVVGRTYYTVVTVVSFFSLPLPPLYVGIRNMGEKKNGRKNIAFGGFLECCVGNKVRDGVRTLWWSPEAPGEIILLVDVDMTTVWFLNKFVLWEVLYVAQSRNKVLSQRAVMCFREIVEAKNQVPLVTPTPGIAKPWLSEVANMANFSFGKKILWLKTTPYFLAVVIFRKGYAKTRTKIEY